MQALLRQLPCCSVPRALTSASAGTSGCSLHLNGWQAAHSSTLQQQQQQQWRQQRHVTQVTGKREEYDIEGITDPEDIWGEDADQEFIEIDNMPVYSPEYGPVHSRIFRDPEEEKETKAISIEDTAYWFADSQGEIFDRTAMVRAAPEVDTETADMHVLCEQEEGFPERLKLSDLEEGDELYGIVTDIWLWHGAFIDVLADFKGLVPVNQAQWIDVEQYLTPGTEVKVRVHKLSEYPKYRFPIHLELLEPVEAVALIPRPEEYDVPANVGWCYEQGWDIKKVAAELGREYEDTVALLEPDQEEWSDRLQYEFGLDAADGNPYPGDWITREVLEEPGMLERVQEMAVADVAGISSSGSSGSGGAADGWGV
uniref:S1 motif domain-containing protein n=1 Tax=Tetradesmus obliquus TaxID=3088 RepID=A0A383W9N2_TETOB|eukprot:jgi/Sobl393_1/3526/SZX74345.1